VVVALNGILAAMNAKLRSAVFGLIPAYVAGILNSVPSINFYVLYSEKLNSPGDKYYMTNRVLNWLPEASEGKVWFCVAHFVLVLYATLPYSKGNIYNKSRNTRSTANVFFLLKLHLK
jgi:hypothetical protein